MADVGLNSTALSTIAAKMREDTAEPDELMPYLEFAAASATYATIRAMEALAEGLKAEEERRAEETRQKFIREIDNMQHIWGSSRTLDLLKEN
jgi:hypothetical protein